MKKFALFGHPVEHSLSPPLHQEFARQFNISISYEKIDPGPQGFAKALKIFQESGAYGANVTSPFKEEAYSLCDELSERAKISQAVNTIIFKPNRKIYGDNTDGAGLVKDIEKNIPYSLSGKHILIIGAGGATRGIIPSLIKSTPASITIANRTPQKAAQLATQFHDVIACGLNELKHHTYDIVINATSSHHNNSELELPPNILNTNALCYDLSYADKPTQFLEWAKQNNAEYCIDGYGMLVEAIAEIFIIWHGVTPKITSRYLSRRAVTK